MAVSSRKGHSERTVSNLRAELAKQQTFIENLQHVYGEVQDLLKSETKAKKLAEIRCKFLEQKSKGLFNRCKDYAEGRVPAGSLSSLGLDIDYEAVTVRKYSYKGRKCRGTQFR